MDTRSPQAIPKRGRGDSALVVLCMDGTVAILHDQRIKHVLRRFIVSLKCRGEHTLDRNEREKKIDVIMRILTLMFMQEIPRLKRARMYAGFSSRAR